MDLCATGLVSEGDQLVADIGARVVGPGGREAPGAPFMPGTLPAASAKTLWLDSNLVGQLVYSAWRADALTSDGVAEVNIGLLSLVAPELEGRYAPDTPVTISVEGQLPPLARAAPVPAEVEGPRGDLALDIGELHLLLEAEGELLFRIGTQLTLVLELVPEDGALRPELVRSEASAWVLEEPLVDAEDDVLASVIEDQVGEATSGLLGDTTIALPELGGAIVPTDATATDGGRYVAVALD